MIFTVLAACLLLVAPFSTGAPLELRGLDQNVQYTYQYIGNVSGGIGEIGGYRDEPLGGRSMVGVGLKALVKIQRQSRDVVVIALADLQIGSRQGDDVNAHGTDWMAMDWQPMPQRHAQQLSKPYLYNTYLSDYKAWVLEVPKNEDPWYTNIRKSIVQAYDQHVPYMVYELEDELCQDPTNATSPEFTKTRRRQTHTLYGHCDTLYSFERVKVLPADISGALVNDIQSPSSQGRKLPSGHLVGSMDYNTTFRVVKTVDFDTCLNDNMPKLIRSDSGNYTNYGRPNTTIDSLNRHVQSIIHVRGSLCGLHRVESAKTEGFVSISPFNDNTQRLQSVTNMSLILQQVSSHFSPMSLQGEYIRINHLYYEAETPYGPGSFSDNIQWIRYNVTGQRNFSVARPVLLERSLLGSKVFNYNPSTTISEIKRQISTAYSYLKLQNQVEQFASDSIKSTKSGEAAHLLYSAQRGVSLLEYQDVQTIYSSYSKSGEELYKRQLLIDIMAASTSGPAIQFLLQKMNPQSQQYDSSIGMPKKTAVMLALSDNIPDPVVVPQLVQFLKSVQVEQNPIAGPIILVAGSKILKKLCSFNTENLFGFPHEIYGFEQCSEYIIKSAYSEHLLENMLQNTTQNNSWKHRVTYLQAYASLGIDVQIDRLQHIAKYDTEKIVRTTAIFGMSRKYQPMKLRIPAVKVLITNVRNCALAPEVRQASLAALLSWNPSQAIWNELADISRRPDAYNIAPYILSVMSSVAQSGGSSGQVGLQQSVFASNAIRRAKPVSTTFDWGHFTSFAANSSRYQTGGRYSQGWIMKNGTSYPDQTYLSFVGSAGRLDANFVEIVQQFAGYNLTAFPPFMPRQSQPQTQEQSKYKLQMKIMNTDIFMPMYFKDVGISEETQSPLMELLWNTISPCGRNSGDQVLQYYNPKAREIFVPSEIGLPVVSKFVSPLVLYAKISDVQKRCDVEHGTFSGSYDAKMSVKAISLLEVFSPWDAQKVVAGVDTEKTATFPAVVQGVYNRGIGQKTGSSMSPIEWMLRGQRGQDPSCQSGDYSKCSNMQVSLKATQQSNIPLLFAQTTPFTALKSLIPGKDFQKSSSTKMQLIRELGNTKRQYLPLFPSTGVNTTLVYEGDKNSPLNWVTVLELLKNPSEIYPLLTSPSVNFGRIILYVDPKSSSNQEATYRAQYSYFLNKEAVQISQPPKTPLAAIFLGLDSQFGQDKQFSLIIDSGRSEGSQSGQPIHSSQTDIFYNSGRGAQISNRNEYKQKLIFKSQTPYIQSLVQLRTHLQQGKPLNITGQAEWYQNGTNTNQAGSKVTEFQFSLGMSDERKNYIIQEVPKVSFPDEEEPEVGLNGRAVYDELNILQKWSKPVGQMDWDTQRTILRVKYVTAGFLYPKMIPDMPSQLDAPTNYMHLNRSLNNLWQGYCFECNPSWTMHDVVASRVIDRDYFSAVQGRRQLVFPDQGSSSYGPYPPYKHLKSQVEDSRRTCISKNSEIKTFDDVTFTKTPNKCFQLLVSDCSKETQQKWGVYTVAPFTESQPELGYLRYVDDETDVLVGGDGFLMINGHRIQRPSAKSQQKSVDIYTKSGERKVGRGDFIPSQKAFQVIIYQKVLLQPAKTQSRVLLIGDLSANKALCGICGNNNRQKTDESMGNKCSDYRDLAVMAASYTTEMKCEQQRELEQQIQAAKRVEQSCSRVSQSRPWGTQLPELPSVQIPDQPLPEMRQVIVESRQGRRRHQRGSLF